MGIVPAFFNVEHFNASIGIAFLLGNIVIETEKTTSPGKVAKLSLPLPIQEITLSPAAIAEISKHESAFKQSLQNSPLAFEQNLALLKNLQQALNQHCPEKRSTEILTKYLDQYPTVLSNAYESHLSEDNSVNTSKFKTASLRELFTVEQERFAQLTDPNQSQQEEHKKTSLQLLNRLQETQLDAGKLSDAIVTLNALFKTVDSLTKNDPTTGLLLNNALTTIGKQTQLQGFSHIASSIATQKQLAQDLLSERSGAVENLNNLHGDHSELASLKRMLGGGYGADIVRSLGAMDDALGQAAKMQQEADTHAKGLSLVNTLASLDVSPNDFNNLLDGTIDEHRCESLVDLLTEKLIAERNVIEAKFGKPIETPEVVKWKEDKYQSLSNITADYPDIQLIPNIKADQLTEQGTLLSLRDRQEALNFLRENIVAARELVNNSPYSQDLAILLAKKELTGSPITGATEKLGIESGSQNALYLQQRQEHVLSKAGQIARYVDAGISPASILLTTAMGGVPAIFAERGIDTIAATGLVENGINPEENATAAMLAPIPVSLIAGGIRNSLQSLSRGVGDLSHAPRAIRHSMLRVADDIDTRPGLIRAVEARSIINDFLQSPTKAVDGLTAMRTASVFNSPQALSDLSSNISGPKALFFMDFNNMGPLSKMGGNQQIDAMLRFLNGSQKNLDLTSLNRYEKAIFDEFQGQANALQSSGLSYEFLRTGGDEFVVVLQNNSKTLPAIQGFISEMERAKQAVFAVSDTTVLQKAAEYAGTRSGMREILATAKKDLGDSFSAQNYHAYLAGKLNSLPSSQPFSATNASTGDLELALLQRDPQFAGYLNSDPNILMGLTPAVVQLEEQLNPELMAKALGRADKVVHSNKGKEFDAAIHQIDKENDVIEIRESTQEVIDQAPTMERYYDRTSSMISRMNDLDEASLLINGILQNGISDPAVPGVMRLGPIRDLPARQLLNIDQPTTINAVHIDIAGFGSLNNQLGYARADEIYRDTVALAKQHFPGSHIIRDNGGGMVILGTKEVGPEEARGFEDAFKKLGLSKDSSSTIFESNKIDEHFAFAEHQQRQALNQHFGFNSEAERAFATAQVVPANNLPIRPQDSLLEVVNLVNARQSPPEQLSSILDSNAIFNPNIEISLGAAAQMSRLATKHNELTPEVVKRLEEARHFYRILESKEHAAALDAHINKLLPPTETNSEATTALTTSSLQDVNLPPVAHSPAELHLTVKR